MNGWGWGWGRGGGERWRGGVGSSASRQRHTADSRNKTTTSSKWKTSVCTTGLRVTSNAQRPLFRHRALVDTHAASIGESCPQRAIRTSGKTSALPPPRIPQPVPKAAHTSSRGPCKKVNRCSVNDERPCAARPVAAASPALPEAARYVLGSSLNRWRGSVPWFRRQAVGLGGVGCQEWSALATPAAAGTVRRPMAPSALRVAPRTRQQA